MYLSVQKLRPHAQLPKRATAQSAVRSVCPAGIAADHSAGEICKVPTGIAVAPSRPDVALCIFPRSGLSTKHGITLINSVGLVDSDYRGELLIPLVNHGTEPFTVEEGMRIAQLVVMPILTPELKEVQRLDTTERGAGGFGASGLS